jgi:echinoid
LTNNFLTAYHDVNSLPDPYADIQDEQNLSPSQHLAFRYDENSESGFSTPNTKNRRVIHEIVV